MKKKYPQCPVSKLQRDFMPLEKEGLNITLSAMAQNIIEFGGDESSKQDLYKRIKKYQPEFLEAVKSIIEK